jgi:hypothetical protein
MVKWSSALHALLLPKVNNSFATHVTYECVLPTLFKYVLNSRVGKIEERSPWFWTKAYCIYSTQLASIHSAIYSAPLEVILKVAEKWFCTPGSHLIRSEFVVPFFCHPQNHFQGCRFKSLNVSLFSLSFPDKVCSHPVVGNRAMQPMPAGKFIQCSALRLDKFYQK